MPTICCSLWSPPPGGRLRATIITEPCVVPTSRQGLTRLSVFLGKLSQKWKEEMASRDSRSMLVTLELRERVNELSLASGQRGGREKWGEWGNEAGWEDYGGLRRCYWHKLHWVRTQLTCQELCSAAINLVEHILVNVFNGSDPVQKKKKSFFTLRGSCTVYIQGCFFFKSSMHFSCN